MLAAGADMAGFVFFAKSPRHVALSKAARLAEPLRGACAVVALLVNPTDAELQDIVGGLKPDLIQLHGAESPARVEQISARFCLPVIKAFGIGVSDDSARLRADVAAYTKAEYALLDAKPQDAVLPGGNGVAFDWYKAAAVAGAKPYLLSGGLTPDTVAEALCIAKPQGVDVSSGVERAIGVKDPDKIIAFVTKARAGFKAVAPQDALV